jgi:hypothetical protein
MRKVGNPSLKPKPIGHHTRTRPPSASGCQAIKVPIAALRDGGQDGASPAGAPALHRIQGAAKQRGWPCRRTRRPPGKSPNRACFRRNRRPGLAVRLKQRQSPATFFKKAGRLRNLGDGLSVSQPPAASGRAKPKMPIFCTENDFSLIRLHQRNAGTISISVTSRERVGRSMSSKRHGIQEIQMNTSLNHGSAKIYQFPTGGRAAFGGRRLEETKTAADPGSLRVSEAACSDSWYHEAAIQESSKPERES